MSLRFFADHCVPSSIIRVLQNAGHQVFVLREHIPLDSSDAAVIARAQELDAILLSLNGDFADITTYPPSEFKGIIALQVKNHPEVISALMERSMGYISGHPESADYRGTLLIAEVHRIRIRR